MEVKPEGKQENEQPMDASMIDQDLVQGQQQHLAGDQPSNDAEDPELEAIKARVREMEEEAAKLKQIHEGITQQIEMNPSQEYARENLSAEEKMEVDNRSIFVGNVDYSATADDLEQHFHGCGSVNRVTILCDKYSGHPKGFAYIEFADKDSVQTAMALDDSLFKGRLIKVSPKRTNRPGLSSTNRGRGRGGGRGGIARGGFGSARGAPWGGPFRPSRRPNRGRGAWFYQPY